MIEKDFFRKFCSNDSLVAIRALIDFKNSIFEFLKLQTSRLTNTGNFTTQDEDDIIQEMTLKLFEKRNYLCEKNKHGDFGNDGFKKFFAVSVRNKVFDIIRKEKSKNKPAKYSVRQIKEATWHQDYSQAKEDLLTGKANLSPLEFEIVKVFCLHKISGCFKLLVVLNILLKQNNWHFTEMEQRGFLHIQIPYNEILNEYFVYDIYKMKKDDLILLLRLEKERIDEIRDNVRKQKQFIKRKLQRQNLWKYIHLPT